jgi:dUTP pyrophosphatase
MKLIVKKLSETALAPKYGDPGAAGADLYSDEDCVIESGKRKCVGTGICVEWIKNNEHDEEPEQFYLRIAPRSGLSVKSGINVLAGICDVSYRGEIKVVLINHGDTDFIINKGDKIAQMIITRITKFDEIEFADELSATERGEKGFGSTGTK